MGLIGALVGIFAVIVDIGVSWLSSMKEGVCRDQLWFNQEQCCWSYNMTVFLPLYDLSRSPLANATLRNITEISLAVPNSTNLNSTTTANTMELIHPHIAGSGAQSAFGFYSCEQV